MSLILPVQDDDSDMEFELEASPPVSVDAVSEAVAHVKVSLRTFIFFFFPLQFPLSLLLHYNCCFSLHPFFCIVHYFLHSYRWLIL